MNVTAILTLGFFLGMRHATDADHVVAVSTIVSRQRTLLAAAPIGILWGLGHTLTILAVGGVIVVFGIVIPPRVGLGMELSVGVMLLLLGAMNLRSILRGASPSADPRSSPLARAAGATRASSLRPLAVGVVHGLAGSAAVALLVLGAVRSGLWGVAYLVVFGAGTIAGMLIITTALATPMVVAVRRSERLHRTLGVVTGLASIAFGAVLVYQIGFVHGLFTGHEPSTPFQP